MSDRYTPIIDVSSGTNLSATAPLVLTGDVMSITPADATHAGSVLLSGTPATNQYLRAAITTGALSWQQIPYTDISGTPSLTGYVPYTGATGAVNLNAQNLTNVGTFGAGAITGTSYTIYGLTVAGLIKNSITGLLSSEAFGLTKQIPYTNSTATGFLYSSDFRVEGESLVIGGDITISTGQIISNSGTITFVNENLSTTGTLSTGTHTVGGEYGITLAGSAEVLTLAGIGGTYNESLTIDFDGAAANTIYFGSSSGATSLDFGAFNFLTTGTLTAGAITGTSLTGTGMSVAGFVKNAAGGLLSTSVLPITVADGGTGLATLTAGYIPYGNGTSAFASSDNLKLFINGTVRTLQISGDGTAPNCEIDFIRQLSTKSCRMFFMTGTNRWDWNFGMLSNTYDFTIIDEYSGALPRFRIKQGTNATVNNIVIDGVNAYVGINKLTPTVPFDVVGAAAFSSTLSVAGLTTATSGIATPKGAITLGAGVTAIAITKGFHVITGDGGGNTIATITGGVDGQFLRLLFVDALVSITDTDAATANTVNLSAAFTSTANDVLTLISDGNKWFETGRSVN